MIRKLLLLLSILGLLTHCGFTPIHLNKNNNFSISTISFKGDKTINNYLKVNLNQFQNNNFDKKFDLEINTTYKKNILAKDKTAKISSYKLSSYSIIKVNSKGKLIKEIKVSETKNMNNIDDKFEEQKKENNIKQNFASTMYKRIITEISMLNDN